MAIKLFHRLSFKLARTSLLVVLLLGLVLAIFDLIGDFQLQNQIINKRISELSEVTNTPAQRAVYLLDSSLADEIVVGLVSYEWISKATLYDENNSIMATADKPQMKSSWTTLTQWLIGKEKTYRFTIHNPNMDGDGSLVIVVDNVSAYDSYFSRSFSSLMKGLLRTFLMGALLVLIYHRHLTRPIFELSRNIANLQRSTGTNDPLPPLRRHELDELGYLVESFNRLLRDIKSQQIDLEQSERQMRIVLDSSPNLVFAVDRNYDFMLVNLATTKFFSKDGSSLIGRNIFSLMGTDRNDETDAMREHFIFALDHSSQSFQIEQLLTDCQQRKRVMNMSLLNFQMESKQAILVIANDITERVEAEARVEKLAYFDNLTQLPNRNQLQEIVFSDLHKAVAFENQGGLFFIDIDDFKRINDTLGHSAGDELLLHLAKIMTKLLTEGQTLARLGGDEFILSIPDLGPDPQTAKLRARELSQKILDAIQKPVELSGHVFSVGASIGIAIFPDAGRDIDKLMQYADTAMYRAKAAGRNTLCIFESAMAEQANKYLQLESEIQQAMENNEFTFFLQPFICTETHALAGAEALIRWRHPQRGWVMPGEFIPFLDQSPMQVLVGKLLLDQVCGFIRAGLNEGLIDEDFRISINIGANEIFHNRFVSNVEETLKKYELNGSSLEMEITEGIALTAFSDIISTMTKLKMLGVSFSLDDFGTGFSSLNYLKKLPVDKIKIDKSFIDDIPRDSQDAALVKSVIDIAHNLQIGVVVEGVETAEQAAWFEQYAILLQGYHFSRPLPAGEFVDKYLNKPIAK